MVWLKLCLTVASVQFAAAQTNYSQYVNPFIGSEGPIAGYAYGGGDIFVGGAVPFGVVKLGIDTWENRIDIATINGGYTPNGVVTGVSMMHESGTGGCPKYGVISQMPLTSVAPPVNILNDTTYWQKRAGTDEATVGYFHTELENGVGISLAGARHAGIIRYDFPTGGKKHVLVDVSHFLPDPPGGFCTQYYLDGSIAIANGGKSYTGHGTYAGGFNLGAPYTVYFCGEFDTTPVQAKTFTGQNTTRIVNGSPPQPTFGGNSAEAGSDGYRVGALFSWSNQNVSMEASSVSSKIGISFISQEKACMFKDTEVPSWDMQDTVKSAQVEWNEDIFGTIQVNTGPEANETLLTLLYSSLYFMHLMPSDRTGENPLWESDEPFWDDFYCIWDTFRNTFSLSHLIQSKAYESQIRGLIDIWRHQGYMPDGRSGNDNGLTQGGSNADNVLADAYVKGLRGAINWEDGYAAMVKDAEISTNGSNKEGRGALNDWLTYGYLTPDSERSISRTVEYSANDFALSQVAKGVRSEDVKKYLKRSAGWQLLWDRTVTSVPAPNTTETFAGFLTPRFANGTFDSTGYNPATCDVCSWPSITYEGTPFEYSFVIPHDVETLIGFMGGSEGFESRLDYIFLPNTSQSNLGANGVGITTIMNIGNEPDFATPYLYNYINKQHKSVNQSRSLGNQYFKNAPFGVPGNSDSGALNSWLIWQMLGMYPVVTQPIYLLGSPWFSEMNMTVNGNKTLRITADGLGKDSYYVQGVKINDQTWDKNWFEHDRLMVEGGTIEFVLGSEPVVWEKGDVPPSPGHVVLNAMGSSGGGV